MRWLAARAVALAPRVVVVAGVAGSVERSRVVVALTSVMPKLVRKEGSREPAGLEVTPVTRLTTALLDSVSGMETTVLATTEPQKTYGQVGEERS